MSLVAPGEVVIPSDDESVDPKTRKQHTTHHHSE